MKNRFMQNHSVTRPCLVLLFLCLCLPGCAAKPPDRGRIPPAGLGDTNRIVYLDVSGTNEASTDEVNALRKCLREKIDRGRWEVVDTPDEKTVTVKVEMRELFSAGRAYTFTPLRWIGQNIIGGTVGGVLLGGTVGFATVGPVGGAFLGMGAGLVTAVDTVKYRARAKIWAVRAGVGIAQGRTPDELEEIVVSTGQEGSLRDDAMHAIGINLADLIRSAIITPSQH